MKRNLTFLTFHIVIFGVYDLFPITGLFCAILTDSAEGAIVIKYCCRRVA